MNGKNRKTTKSMHVLFTGLVFPKVLTGGDQLFFDIAPRLPKDIKIIIVMPHFAEEYWDKIDKTNIEFRLLPANRFEFSGNPVYIFLSYVIRAWQVYRILKNENVQTIYSCSDIAYADIWPAYFLSKKGSGVKWLSRIYHVLLPPKKRQGNFFVNIIAFRLQRLSFWMMKRRSSTIFPLNSKLHDEVLELGLPINKLKVLGAGIDYETISKFKAKSKYSYEVAVLGRIAPVKGIFDAVKAWERVHALYPDVKLAWIGGGGDSYRKKIEQQLTKLSLEESFHLLGFLDKDEVYSILKSAKIFLCPDHENGWGLAVCEAMSCGLPVVSYDLDIFGSVYKQGYTTAPLYDTTKFADAIIELLRNEKLRYKLAKEAFEQAREFDHKKVVKTLTEYL